MKSKIGILVTGLVVISLVFIVFPMKTIRAAGDFPCEAGGPYSGIAHNANYNYYLPVYFQGTYGPIPGPSQLIQLTWTFGDGTYAYEANPVHQYYTPGNYNVNFSVDAEPYHAWDTASATIYSNNWIISTKINALRNWVFQFGTLHFYVQTGSAAGHFDNTPPFQTVIELWQNGQKVTELDRHNWDPLAPGANTGWYDYAFTANNPPGQYEMREKVVFPNGLDYQLCDPSSFSFQILEWK